LGLQAPLIEGSIALADDNIKPLKWIAKPLCSVDPRPTPVWLIKDVLPKGFLTVLKGKPGALKTYVLISWVMCLDTGTPWCGRRVIRDSSLLITPDDPRGAIIRAQAFADYFSFPREDVRSSVFEEPVNLAIKLDVEGAVENILRQGLKPGILGFDTLFHNSVGANLKEADVMLNLLGNMRWMGSQIPSVHTLITTHHPPKTGEGAYGSISLVADVGVIYDCEKLAPDRARLTCERMKHDRAPEAFEIRTETVEVDTRCEESDGEHKVGDVVTVEEMVVAAEGAAGAKINKLRDTMEMALSFYLQNSATNKVWFRKVVELTPLKQGKDGKMKPGLSESTFGRELKKIIQEGHVIGPPDDNSQNFVYSIVAGPFAPWNVVDGQNHRQTPPPLGGGVVDGGLGAPSSAVKPPSNKNDGGSQDRNADSSLADEALALMTETTASEQGVVDEALAGMVETANKSLTDQERYYQEMRELDDLR
jgi:hypothetical protein